MDANSLLNLQIYLHQQQLSPSLLLQWRKYLFPIKGQFFLKCSGSDFPHFLKDCIFLVLPCLYCIINVSHATKSFTSCKHALASPNLQNIRSNNNLLLFLPIYVLFFVCLFCWKKEFILVSYLIFNTQPIPIWLLFLHATETTVLKVTDGFRVAKLILIFNSQQNLTLLIILPS